MNSLFQNNSKHFVYHNINIIKFFISETFAGLMSNSLKVTELKSLALNKLVILIKNLFQPSCLTLHGMTRLRG